MRELQRKKGGGDDVHPWVVEEEVILGETKVGNIDRIYIS